MNGPISTIDFYRVVPGEQLPLARQKGGEERASNLPPISCSPQPIPDHPANRH